MKKNYTPYLVAILLASIIASFTGMTDLTAQAGNTQEKIRLMVSALQARDNGDLEKAKENLEALLQIVPNDPGAQKMLLDVNKDIERQQQGQAPRLAGPAAQSTPLEAPVPPAHAEGLTPVEMTTPPEATIAESRGAAESIDALMRASAADQRAQMQYVRSAIQDARRLSTAGNYEEADNVLARAAAELPQSIATQPLFDDIQAERNQLLYLEARAALNRKDIPAAQATLDAYIQNAGNTRQAQRLAAQIEAARTNPRMQSIDEVSPNFVSLQREINDLLVRGRAQFLYGDYDGAINTYRQVELLDPDNVEAKAYLIHITNKRYEQSYLNHKNTRTQMLQDVAQGWQLPRVYARERREEGPVDVSEVLKKLQAIQIPRISFQNASLSRAIDTLSELSVEYDPEREGVNIVLIDTGGRDPEVNITLRNLSLDKMLDLIVRQVNFQFDIEGSVVAVRPSEGGAAGVSSIPMDTRIFPITRGVVIRLTGFQGGGGAAPSRSADPFADPGPVGGGMGGGGGGAEETALKSFFQRAGVDFNVPGSSLAFDGAQIIVTNTRRNLERLANILQRYSDVKQVEIEAKFLEVQQGALEELGFRWNVRGGDALNRRFGTMDGLGQESLRNLNQTFRTAQTAQPLTVETNSFIDPNTGDLVPGTSRPFPSPIPSLPSAINLGGQAASAFSGVIGVIDGYQINLIIDALEQQQGSDLMSAPKLTVLSDKTATITVAQKLRYPTRFTDIQSNVGSTAGGSGGTGGSGSAGVTITAGTPEDFETEDVGVVMRVTPRVQEDDSISLELSPRVTEFEGFIEYGGTSIAISSGTTVTVPSGFIQPVFSVREISTEVTIFDGATVVMGGLTREEVKTVNDKVPVLGDLPLLGRFFRSKGQTSQKRNLLIFVTANLISPGGSPARQSLPGLQPGALFQNPVVVTPGGSILRSGRDVEELPAAPGAVGPR